MRTLIQEYQHGLQPTVWMIMELVGKRPEVLLNLTLLRLMDPVHIIIEYYSVKKDHVVKWKKYKKEELIVQGDDLTELVVVFTLGVL